MKIQTLAWVGLVATSFALSASADNSWYTCFNTNAAVNHAPANVLSLADPQQLEGMFNAANVEPPRALFVANPLAGGQPLNTPAGETGLAFGTVDWQGKHDGFQDFKWAAAYFDAKGAMTKITYFFDSPVDYTNCVIDP